jgi:hypothetical protein
VAAVERALAATPAAGARGASSAPNLALREEMLSIVISVEAVRLN